MVRTQGILLAVMAVWVTCPSVQCAVGIVRYNNRELVYDGYTLGCLDKDDFMIPKLRHCLPRVRTLGGKCAEDYQCLLPHVPSACVGNRCVICAESEHEPYGNCKDLSVLAVNCSTNNDCTAQHSTCRHDVCKCDSNFVASTLRKDRCLRKASNVGDDCQEDVQCSSTQQTSSCRVNKCVTCTDAMQTLEDNKNCTDTYGCTYHEYENKCWKRRELNESCFNPEECFIHPTANETRACLGDRCRCNQDLGYKLGDGSQAAVGEERDCVKTGKRKAEDAEAAKQLKITSSGASVMQRKWSALATTLITTSFALRCTHK